MASTPIVCSIDIRTQAERVFQAWTRVADWHRWDPLTRAASLNGPAQRGTQGRLVPTQGRAVPMVVQAVEPGRRFYVSCPVLGSALHFDHQVQALGGDSVSVTHTVWFSGWLAPMLQATLGRALRRDLPHTMSSLKRFLEAGG